MRIRFLPALLPIALSLAVFAPHGFAQPSEQEAAIATEKARTQLAALTDPSSSVADRAFLDEAQVLRRAATMRVSTALNRPSGPDPVVHRLDSVFKLVLSDEHTAAIARLPRARPAGSIELVALAYAEGSGDARRAEPTGGLSAIEELVREHAEANDVPPALALALVKVESGFNPKATGRRGEMGLLQIKPQTARAMGYKGPPKALYDADTNLAWGMKYLGRAHDLSGGDTCGTLLRYNGGLDAKRASKGSNKFCAKVKKVMAQQA